MSCNKAVELPVNIPRLDISDNALEEAKEKLDNFLFMRTSWADVCFPENEGARAEIFNFLKILKWREVPQAKTWSDDEDKSVFAKTRMVRIAPMEE